MGRKVSENEDLEIHEEDGFYWDDEEDDKYDVDLVNVGDDHSVLGEGLRVEKYVWDNELENYVRVQ